jgi:hypothetical protein
MDLGRTRTWLLAITLAHFPIYTNADVLQDSFEFCRKQNLTDADACHIQPCPCNPAYKTLAKFSDPGGGFTLCACGSPQRSRQHTRQLAVETCNKYRIEYRQPCFISRGNCPQGFEALQTYVDSADTKFTACRDKRHEQPKPDRRALPAMVEYDQLISILKKARQGAQHSLPTSTIEQLSPYFRGTVLNRVTFTHTKALSNGCFSDCEHVYCASAETIDSWTRPQNPLLSRLLLHQIAHAESCEREGGRERYVSHWLRYLPDAVRQKLLAGKSVNADEIHFAMYMERHAEKRAERLCLTIPGCRME